MADCIAAPDYEAHPGIFEQVRRNLPPASTLTQIARSFAAMAQEWTAGGQDNLARLAKSLGHICLAQRDGGGSAPSSLATSRAPGFSVAMQRFDI